MRGVYVWGLVLFRGGFGWVGGGGGCMVVGVGVVWLGGLRVWGLCRVECGI